MKVDFLPKQRIERAALSLLGEYGAKFGVIDGPPIPAEGILESHLQLNLGFDDLSVRLGAADVLGATWVLTREVLVDESLDPSVYPQKEGRYRFTVAHEVGHWELHRHPFLQNASQNQLFESPSKPSIVCRSRSTKDQMEWQADQFAGYLLMPREMVHSAWRARFGSLEPYVAAGEIADLSARWGLGEDEHPTVQVAKELAREFEVSGQAMQIRLVGLGLILTKPPQPDLFSKPQT